jgi:cell division protein FtsW (lipid II flippase)
METIVVSIAKYLILLCMGFYTVTSFNILRNKPERKKRKMANRQIFLMFLVHFIAFVAICFVMQDEKYFLFYGGQVIYLIVVLGLYPAFYPKISKPLLNNMCMLTVISFIILTRLDFDKALRQFIILSGAMVITMFVPLLIVKIKNLYKLTWVYCIVGLVLLGIVLVLGMTSYGAKLSISVGGISIQPSEFVKILFVFYVAAILSAGQEFKTVVIATAFAALHVIILVLSTDLGSGLIFFLVYLFMLYVATKKTWYLFAGLAAGSVASVLAYFLFSHVQVRVAAWLDPWSIIDGKGYQITQSLFAIGSGGWFGSGLYQGEPNAIPTVEKDFVFSAIAEELGGFVAISIILICLCCFMIFIQVAMMQKKNFYKLIAVGLGSAYTFQVFLTVGGAMKMIPSTGVTLPLISYGGTSVLVTLTMFAIIQGLHIIGRNEEEADEARREAYERAERRGQTQSIYIKKEKRG